MHLTYFFGSFPNYPSPHQAVIPVAMTCQICFDDNIPIASNNDIGGALCRRSCTARVCVSCLTRHVETSLAGFYAGVLPLIRCPICLLPMRVDRWARPLGAEDATVKKISELREQYESLCKKACSLTPACCEMSNYTHLPECDASAKKVGQVNGDPELIPPETIEYHELIARFCGHHVDAQDVLAYAMDHFKKNDVQDLVERTLPRIDDSERRARLLLAFLYRFPNILTRCCKVTMCFNCKRAEHHDKCKDFDEAVDESECLMRCRNCRVMLMRVEGCDSVVCVCGLRLSWTKELALKRIEVEKQREQARRERLNAWIQTYKPLMSAPVERWMWRIRLSEALVHIERAFVWRMYYLAHPEEKHVVQEEEASFFMIDV